MNVQKQLSINKLSLPFDIINNIKSYVFYDKMTFEKISFIRNKKKELNNQFENEEILFYCFHNWENGRELLHTWSVNYYNNKNNYSITFMVQAEMCLYCGNYVKSNNEILPLNIRCNCLNII